MTAQHPRTSDHQLGASEQTKAVVPPISTGQGGELAARLRGRASYEGPISELLTEAADAIDALRRERDSLRSNYETAQANWNLTLDRAEQAERERDEARAALRLREGDGEPCYYCGRRYENETK